MPPWAKHSAEELAKMYDWEPNIPRPTEEKIVTAKGLQTKAKKKLQTKLEDIITPAYIGVVKKACPWMSGLTVSMDDETDEWFALFDRDGEKEVCALGGKEFPKLPEDFVKCVQKHLLSKVDHSSMKKVAADLAEWE